MKKNLFIITGVLTLVTAIILLSVSFMKMEEKSGFYFPYITSLLLFFSSIFLFSKLCVHKIREEEKEKEFKRKIYWEKYLHDNMQKKYINKENEKIESQIKESEQEKV